MTHNSYGPRVNCNNFLNKCLKNTAYLLKEYIRIRKKYIFDQLQFFFSLKTSFSLIDFDVSFPIQSSIGNTISRYNFPV